MARTAAVSLACVLATCGAQNCAIDPDTFDLAKLSTAASGEPTQWDFFYEGRSISPWHDVPFRAKGGDDLLHFVCEIARGTTAKYEVHKRCVDDP